MEAGGELWSMIRALLGSVHQLGRYEDHFYVLGRSGIDLLTGV